MADPNSGERWFPYGHVPAAIGALVVFAYLSFAQDLFGDGDTSWHLAAGRLILDMGIVPRTDPFSFTFKGSPWTAHEWLAEVMMAGAFEAGSWAGLGLLTALAVALVMLITGTWLRRSMEPRHVVAALALLFIVLTPAILARPHVLAWPLLAAWTVILLRARQEERAPPLLAALLMLIWANLHGSFLFGFVLAGLFGLEALLEEKDRRRVILGWGAFGGLSLFLSLATPAGVEGLLFPLQVSSMEALELIEEWRPSSPARDPLFFAVAGGALLLLLLKRPRLSVLRLLLLALLGYLAIAHARHQSLLAIVATLMIAPALAANGASAMASRWHWRPLVLLAAGFAILALVRLSVPVEVEDSGTNPRAAIAALPPDLRSRPVFNSYGFGGPLILSGIAPFIDGRADMYGDEFTFQSRAIEDGDASAFQRAVEKWGIRWTILYPKTPLVAVLDNDPEWRRLYADEWAVVHVRTGAQTKGGGPSGAAPSN